MLIHGKNNNALFYVMAPLFFLSSFNEQVAAVNLALLVLLYFVSGRNIQNLFLAFITASVLFYIVSAPGNFIRINAEIARWMPEYTEFGVFDKIMMGLNLCANQLFDNSSIPVSLVFIAISLVSRNKWIVILSCLSGIVFLSFSFSFDIRFEPVRDLVDILQPKKFELTTLYTATSLLRVAIGMLFVVLMAVLLSTIIVGTKWKIIAAGCVFFSFAPTGVLGFSPTIYASSYRIMFLSYIMITTIAVYVVSMKYADPVKSERHP